MMNLDFENEERVTEMRQHESPYMVIVKCSCLGISRIPGLTPHSAVS